MIRKFIIGLLLSLSLYVFDPWTKTQVGLEVGYQLALLADWRQTSNFHKMTRIYDWNGPGCNARYIRYSRNN